MKDLKELKTISEVEKYRKEMNESCDKRNDYLSLLNKANDLSSSCFGYIKEAYESLSPMLFKTNEGRELINKYTNLIKNNEDLRTMYGLYESIRKSNKNSDVNFFVSHISEGEKINKDKFNEGKSKLGKILSEAYILLNNKNISLPSNNEVFHKSVEYVMENKKKFSNLSTYSSAIKTIKDQIMEQDGESNIFEERQNKSINDLLKEFNDKYSNELSEKEMSIIKEISNSDNKVEVFNKYKNICIEQINKSKCEFEVKKDTTSFNKLESMLEQINMKEYSNDTLSDDIHNFLEISEILKEE